MSTILQRALRKVRRSSSALIWRPSRTSLPGSLTKLLLAIPNLISLGRYIQRSVTQFRQAVSIEGLKPNIGDFPGSIGFLALMVFAAYNMQEEEGIDESNYFFRLREILNLPLYRGRPEGMPTGTEEPLWKAWNRYLTHAGFQETAERGAGPQTYLRYMLSQLSSVSQISNTCECDSVIPISLTSSTVTSWAFGSQDSVLTTRS